ncbi:urease accessory protein UreE [Cyanobium sp. PCC 7001]|uniref:urease accessory protein UreE n=1 Tax=Cyanobium sp. PCC 7001 TaxID=180281 RepID=UPI0001805ABF|nr:urease accessory protein UreE [Cyanobium sp. PCC 7001]EDY39819.1 urease accessory protein UreE [Cyanobium sp. PCC 7001]
MIPAATPDAPASGPLLLTRRLGERAGGAATLSLALTAEERTRLRGLRQSVCGCSLLLQLPRGEPLRPGELLGGAAAEPLVRIEAALEPLLRVTAASELGLLQAAYHLGNRHVAMEIRAGELRLLADPVLAQLLEHRGLSVTAVEAPFLPEAGAYAQAHAPTHAHPHVHLHGH